MALFFQENIDAETRLGIWKIEEDENFFKQKVSLHRAVTHYHSRLQHLAGRFLLKYLFPDFPSNLIQIADTKKPFLPNDTFDFSISHCGNFAAAIVSRTHRVGIDIEIPQEKVRYVSHKFINENEFENIHPKSIVDFTKIWSAKEAVYKWYGQNGVDFRQHIHLFFDKEKNIFNCRFAKTLADIDVQLKQFDGLCLSFVCTKKK
jgi:phosphopantetheinyl transferase